MKGIICAKGLAKSGDGEYLKKIAAA